MSICLTPGDYITLKNNDRCYVSKTNILKKGKIALFLSYGIIHDWHFYVLFNGQLGTIPVSVEIQKISF